MLKVSTVLKNLTGLEAGELHDLLSLQGILGDERPKVMEIVNIQMTPEQCLPSAVFAHLQRSLQEFLNPTETWYVIPLNSFSASGDFCCLLITFANSLDLDQA